MRRRLGFLPILPTRTTSAPRSLLFVVLPALVAVQAAGLLVVGVLYLVALRGGGTSSTTGTVFAALASVIVGLGLLAAARGLHRRRRWARAPVLVTQLLVALVAAGPGGVVQGGLLYVGAALFLYALIVLALLFAPGVTAELND